MCLRATKSLVSSPPGPQARGAARSLRPGARRCGVLDRPPARGAALEEGGRVAAAGSATSASPSRATTASSRRSSGPRCAARRGRRPPARARRARVRAQPGRPTQHGGRQPEPVRRRIGGGELDRFGSPVGCEHVGARARGGKGRQREAAAHLQDADLPSRSSSATCARERARSATARPSREGTRSRRSDSRRSGSRDRRAAARRARAADPMRSSLIRLACHHDEEAARCPARGARSRGVSEPGAGARDRGARAGIRQARHPARRIGRPGGRPARRDSSPAAARSSHMLWSFCASILRARSVSMSARRPAASPTASCNTVPPG